MFQDVSGALLNPKQHRFSLENIQFELFNTYIKHSSERLALKEAELLTQTQLFLDKCIDQAYQNQKKSLNDCCTTEASIEYYCSSEKQSTHRSRGSRNAFQRKSKLAHNRPTKGVLGDALQQIKEVCSERTICTAEHLFGEYQRLSEERHVSDYRESQVRRKRDKCQACELKDSQLLLRTQEFQEKIENLNHEIQRLQIKSRDQQESLREIKKQSEETDKQRKAMFAVCKDFLKQKEASLATKTNELRMIEHSISCSLRQVVETVGCIRCEVVRSVRGQLLQYRRYYQCEFGKLQKWYRECRRQMVH